MQHGLTSGLTASAIARNRLRQFEVVRDNVGVNATVPVHALRAVGSEANIDVAIIPKGTGAVMRRIPDGTSVGGNKRGVNAFDFGIGSATSVATGTNAIVMGAECSASGNRGNIAMGNAASASASGNQLAIAIGNNVTASGEQSTVIGGRYNTASGVNSFCLGNSSVAAGSYSFVTGHGTNATRRGERASANGQFAASGDAQFVRFVSRNKTTDATPTELFLDGSSIRLTIPSGKIFHGMVTLVGSKSDGTAVATYIRKVALINLAGTTTLVGSVETIGTDTAAGTSIAITADDTNDSLKMEVTGIAAETWRWVAAIEGVELAYGT